VTNCLEYLSRTNSFLTAFFTHTTRHTKPREFTLQYLIPFPDQDLLYQLSGTILLVGMGNNTTGSADSTLNALVDAFTTRY
jgi:hypothetical protein